MTHAQVVGLLFLCVFPIGWIAMIIAVVAEQSADRRPPTQGEKP